MILISKTSLNTLTKILIFISLLFPFLAIAQNSQSLSVSPTLFEMTANPAQEWSSGIRVINPNPYEIKVYANVVNFAPLGEDGRGKFIPVFEQETDGSTLAEWIDVQDGEIIVPAEGTIQIPFKINVPSDAAPGGHFSAILIGTKPPENDINKPLVQTSQVVTSLVFLRVTGDVVESGDIRSFRAIDSFVEKPEVDFELRFENKGNVHILPQGEIKISNMWGQERGIIPVNRETMFGNVLPNSVRNYSFSWKGEWSLADMGRYSAVATLGYGYEQKQFASSETYFWVIPWKGVTLVLLVIFGFFAFFTWALKLYVRKMLSMAGVPAPGSDKYYKYSEPTKRVSVAAPIEAGMLDLRGRLEASGTLGSRLETYFGFVRSYKLFFLAVVTLIMFVWALVWFISSAVEKERSYEVKIGGDDGNITISSEDIEYEQLKEKSEVKLNIDDALPKIEIVNRSGQKGIAANLKLSLEGQGYEVVNVTTDLGVSEENTVIVYPPELAEEALQLSKLIEDSLLSSFEGGGENGADMTVYVGKSFKSDVQ